MFRKKMLFGLVSIFFLISVGVTVVIGSPSFLNLNKRQLGVSDTAPTTTVSSSITNPSPFFTPSPTPEPKLETETKPQTRQGGGLFSLVNSYRSQNGRTILQWFNPLCEYASTRSNEVITNWSHDGYLRDAESRVLYEKYCPNCTKTGEILARGYSSDEAILQAWINSSSHRESLLADWTYACTYFYGKGDVGMFFGRVQ